MPWPKFDDEPDYERETESSEEPDVEELDGIEDEPGTGVRPLAELAGMVRDLLAPSSRPTVREPQRVTQAPTRPPSRKSPGQAQRPTRHARDLHPVIRDDWTPILGQQLFPKPAPLNAPACKHCISVPQFPTTYWIVSPMFQSGIGLCHIHAEQERYAPDTIVYLISW